MAFIQNFTLTKTYKEHLTKTQTTAQSKVYTCCFVRLFFKHLYPTNVRTDFFLLFFLTSKVLAPLEDISGYNHKKKKRVNVGRVLQEC